MRSVAPSGPGGHRRRPGQVAQRKTPEFGPPARRGKWNRRMDCNTDEHDCLRWALKYASYGWRVFPVWQANKGICTCQKAERCTNPGKHPRTRHGFQDGTTDERRIRLWKWASANIGIATGAESNLVVVDVDSQDSRTWIKRELSPVPPTVIARTGGGWWHLLFRHPGGYVASTNETEPHIRADGGFIVAPPSIHKSGNRYSWQRGCDPDTLAPAELPPDWVERLLSRPQLQGCYTGAHEAHVTQGGAGYTGNTGDT